MEAERGAIGTLRGKVLDVLEQSAETLEASVIWHRLADHGSDVLVRRALDELHAAGRVTMERVVKARTWTHTRGMESTRRYKVRVYAVVREP